MYRIFLSDKLRRKSIRGLFKVIDLFQSYDVDWQTYFIDINAEVSSAERLTSIPTSSGALIFREFYFSEEKLIEILGKRFDKKYVERFVKGKLRLDRLLGERRIEKILYNYPEIIDSTSIEIYFPLTDKIDLRILNKNIGESKFIVELIETSYSYIDPKIIEKILEESYFLEEYLAMLWEKYMDKSIMVKKGYILLAKGVIDAHVSLTQLETYIDRFIKNVNHRNISMMFNRIF